MNKRLILAIYLLGLAALVNCGCDCCDQCGVEEEEYIEPEGTCPALKRISSGLSGSCWASRYWDCCKPSCSWSDNAGWGNEARECDTFMNVLSNKYTTSVCNGGSSTTCLSQIPFTLSGCDNIGFAFASVPGAGPKICGRCFVLEFTGYGKYETKLNHQKLKGKQLVVMATNIGYDVDPGQFDIMIPGGGVGLFNGCAPLFGSANMGQQYGGLLAECNDVKHAGDSVSCLKEACQTAFGSVPQALQGCLWSATFLEAADNPNMTFEEIECPDVLKSKY